MFCTECGQSIADDAKFCAYCGTRRKVAASTTTPPAASSPEPPVAPRPVRSTAEIMPIRMQRPPVPQPRVTEAGPVETEADESVGSVEESTPYPSFAQYQAAPERPPVPPPAPATPAPKTAAPP